MKLSILAVAAALSLSGAPAFAQLAAISSSPQPRARPVTINAADCSRLYPLQVQNYALQSDAAHLEFKMEKSPSVTQIMRDNLAVTKASLARSRRHLAQLENYCRTYHRPWR